MHSFKFTKALAALAVAMTFGALTACDEEPFVSAPPEENTIPGQEVGVKRLKVSLPRLSRFDNVIDHVSCRVHLRGRADRVTYPVNTFISADKDSIYIEADDPILSELPHQLYNLNALTFPRKNMTARSEDALAEDTVYVGARLSLEDPNNIRFRSSFNVGANSIGAGTEEDPWIIASGDDFMMRVSDPMTRGETHEGKFFEITRNINLNTAYVTAGKGWEPAGHNNINGGSTDFNGTINGCDNYIENLICFTDAGCGGLFYSLGESAYIHNLEMRRVMLNGDSDVGAIASTSKNGCRLDSLSVNGTIEANENAGGFIGRGEVKIKCCISSVNMSTKTEGEGKFIGGMIGQTDNSTFTDCIRTGKIDAPNADYVGGYTGGSKTTKNAVQTTYTRCYVSGSVIGSSDVGGFAGKSCADFTNCHAAATLPVGSYTYTVQWDIFNVNNRMTPMPLEVKANDSNAGGFVGTSHYLLIHGENSFAYSSPAKPNVIGVSGGNVGALAGWCDYRGDANATFTSNAYVQGPSGSICTGGIAGYLENYGDGGTFVNNGNVIGGNHTGGVIGGSNFFGEGNPIQISCKNYGNVKGEDNVGGVIGNAGEIDGADLENYGNVEGTGNCVGGLIGKGSALKFGEDCRVGTENGSLKISGAAEVGGLCGHIEADNTKYLIERYCPVYANIISSAGTAGGLIGYLKVDKNGTESCEIFKNHSPVHVSISVESGDKAGGVIGSLEITGNGQTTTVRGFDDKLQATITSSGKYVGGITGYVSNTSSVCFSQCHSFTSITSTASEDVYFYGGILGGGAAMSIDALTLSISHCSNHGALSVPTGGSVGGILGMYYSYASGQQMRVENCYNAGRVDADNSVGGIVGLSSGLGIIRCCFNMGEVPSVSGRKNLAGIVGHVVNNGNVAITTEQCYNVGKTGWGIIGGDPKSAYKIKDCYYLDTASNGDMKNSGSKSKTADEMRKQATYKDWLTNDWTFHDGEAAPTLKDVPMFNEKLPLQK